MDISHLALFSESETPPGVNLISHYSGDREISAFPVHVMLALNPRLLPSVYFIFVSDKASFPF